MSRDELLATLDLSRMRRDHAHDSTLKPTMAPLVARERRQASDGRAAPSARWADELGGSGNTIRVKEPLAEGGMGVIKVAEQGALRREVAIKTLRDEFLDDDFIARLMREARITGMVEHPNIVPIYALQADDRGAPMMVMKRIEGVSWRALIRDPDHHSGLVDHRDPLVFHLEVLMRVCEAVHYAHSRGILHLDLKPDNVMIGGFHDVYLVDWGVAVSTRKEHRGFLPMVDEICEVLGTPAYIAPEMVDIAHQRPTELTDVYLLGAVLYEILTGEAPHKGGSVQDTLFAAYEARAPRFESYDVPEELARIAQKAMDPSPSRRFESAEAMRDALADFLRHRTSARLSQQSAEALEAIRRDLSRAPDDEDVGRRLQRRFSECRFGFAQSLKDWPDNRQAQRGLIEATLLMAGFHLDRGEAASAEALLDELGEIPRDAEQRVELLREGTRLQRLETERLQRFSDDQDDTRSRKARAIYVLILASSLNAPVFLAWVFQQFGLYRYAWWHSVAYTFAVAAFLGVGAAIMRRDLMPNRASRRLIVTICVLALLILVRRLLALKMGHDEIADMSIDVFLFGAGCTVIGVLTDRRFLAPAVAFTLSAVSILFFPAHTFLWVALAAFCGPGAMAFLWLHSDRQRRKKEASRSRRRPRTWH